MIADDLTAFSTSTGAATFMLATAPKALADLGDHLFQDDRAFQESRNHARFVVDELDRYHLLLTEEENQKLITTFWMIIDQLQELQKLKSRLLPPTEKPQTLLQRIFMKNVRVTNRLAHALELREAAMSTLTVTGKLKTRVELTTMGARMRKHLKENGDMLATPLPVPRASVDDADVDPALISVHSLRVSTSTVSLHLRGAFLDPSEFLPSSEMAAGSPPPPQPAAVPHQPAAVPHQPAAVPHQPAAAPPPQPTAAPPQSTTVPHKPTTAPHKPTAAPQKPITARV